MTDRFRPISTFKRGRGIGLVNPKTGAPFSSKSERYVSAMVNGKPRTWITAKTPSISKRAFQQQEMKAAGGPRTLEERARQYRVGSRRKLDRREISRLKKDFPKQTYYEARRFEELEARMAADPRAKPLSKDDYIFRQVVRKDYEEDPAFRDKYPRPVRQSRPVRQRETVSTCASRWGA